MSNDQDFRQILQRIAAFDRTKISSDALSHAALVVADSIAIAIGTRKEPEIQAFRSIAEQRSNLREATLIGGDANQADRFLTAASNALAMTTSEFDGGSTNTPCHAGLYTLPALLAEAEANSLTCADVLQAEVLAYEAVVRFAGAWTSGGDYPNLYTHARCGTLGAACGRALARRADGQLLCDAVGIAATLTAAGPRNHLLAGAMVRNIWPASSTWNGMMSVEWATLGSLALETAVADVFEGVFGQKPKASQLLSPLGPDWQILHGYHRIYASHLFCNALIECLLEVRQQIANDSALDMIQAIDIEIHADAATLDNRRPTSTLEARFSMPHLAAATLHYGDAGLPAFSTDAIDNPAIGAMRNQVTLRALPTERFPKAKWPAALSVTAAGKRYSAARAEAKGGHGEPHPASAILDKIDRIVETDCPEFGLLARRLTALEPSTLKMKISDVLRTTQSQAKS